MAQTEITLWHNPRCSKSRSALKLLRDRGYEPTIFEYLKARLTPSTIEELLDKLEMEPQELLRKKEAVYREMGLKNVDDRYELAKAMAYNPSLIERPVLIHGKHAVIGRPPEKVLSIV